MAWIGAAIAAVVGVVGAIDEHEQKNEAQESQEAQVQESRDYIEQNGQRARDDLTTLFPSAGQSRQAGNQAALDIFAQQLPQQQYMFQEGNVAAQERLNQGNQQAQNALMGNPVNNNFAPYRSQIPQMNVPEMLPATNTNMLSQLASQGIFGPQAQQQAQGPVDTRNDDYGDHYAGWEIQLADQAIGPKDDWSIRDINGLGFESNIFNRYF